ncbi:hypothetical protein [Dietzia lutea]|uniref:hypothetical protein n=1 Tax=Dietzia lutea TaxID=546160 RepID=UPI001FC981E4|nr:hypothetical protein [Dietzia lutea]
MEDAERTTGRVPDAAVVGPASGARCLHRVARERDARPGWWRTAPLDEGVRLRAHGGGGSPRGVEGARAGGRAPRRPRWWTWWGTTGRICRGTYR